MNSTSLSDKYINEAKSLRINKNFEEEGAFFWRSPSNIALIKYWGKKENQIPTNPSLSFSLSNSYTDTKLYFAPKKDDKNIEIEFYFENAPNIEFEKRIKNYFEKISEFEPFLKQLKIKIYSTNSFPHSSGIASSASALSSIALGICSIEQKLFKTLESKEEFYQKASFLARLGSGSACRSIYNGFNLWGHTEFIDNSSDEVAIPINSYVNDIFFELRDTILIVSAEKKKVSSSLGHSLMENHIFGDARRLKAISNLKELLTALKTGDLSNAVKIIRNEALMLHALMMSSDPPFILIKPDTLKIINHLDNFINDTKLPITYTLDAGPNIHLIYPNRYHQQILDFIKTNIIDIVSYENIKFDLIGGGCQLLAEK